MFTFYIIFQVILLYEFQRADGTKTVYFRRKAELGYFSLYLIAINKPSPVQCVGACALVDGCSMISFSQSQSLCHLSTGTGIYIVDPGWISLSMHVPEIKLQTSPKTTFTSQAAEATTQTTTFKSPATEATTHIATFTFEITDTTTQTTTFRPQTFDSTPKTTTFRPQTYEATAQTTTFRPQTTEATVQTTTFRPQTTEAATFTPETTTEEKTSTSESITSVSSTTSSTQSTAMSTTTMSDPVCPPSYTMAASGFCFQIIVPFQTFDQAKQTCLDSGGYLATITSNSENSEVVALLNSRSDLTRDVFLGGTDADVEGTWKWITTDLFTGWISGGPTNFHSLADCLAYSKARSWDWVDVVCSRQYHSVCKAVPS